MAVLMLTAVVGGLLLPSAVGVAAAQNGDNSTAEDGADAADEKTVMHELGGGGSEKPGAVIRDIAWDGRTVSITVHANEYTTMSVNDAGAFANIDEGNSKEIAYETYTIPSDSTRTIEFDVASADGVRAVAINAHGTMIGEVEDGYGIISGSASWSEVQAGAAGGILAGAGMPLSVTVVIAVAGRWNHQRVF